MSKKSIGAWLQDILLNFFFNSSHSEIRSLWSWSFFSYIFQNFSNTLFVCKFANCPSFSSPISIELFFDFLHLRNLSSWKHTHAEILLRSMLYKFYSETTFKFLYLTFSSLFLSEFLLLNLSPKVYFKIGVFLFSEYLDLVSRWLIYEIPQFMKSLVFY